MYAKVCYISVRKQEYVATTTRLTKTVAKKVNIFENCLSQLIVALNKAVPFTTLLHLYVLPLVVFLGDQL